jgi:hypothetical protein
VYDVASLVVRANTRGEGSIIQSWLHNKPPAENQMMKELHRVLFGERHVIQMECMISYFQYTNTTVELGERIINSWPSKYG